MPRIVMAVLVREDTVLLCHRHPEREWYPDVWDLPGGHVEPGETPAEALGRELREELGVEAAVADEPFVGVNFGDIEAQVWQLDRWEGDVGNRAPDEHDALGWFRMDELAGLAMADDEIRTLCRLALDQSAAAATDTAND